MNALEQAATQADADDASMEELEAAEQILDRLRESRQRALRRIRRAGVAASDHAILCWISTVGPAAILQASLTDIRATAAMFQSAPSGLGRMKR